jgi:hypothetical protein
VVVEEVSNDDARSQTDEGGDEGSVGGDIASSNELLELLEIAKAPLSTSL